MDQEQAIELIKPFFEGSVVVAAEYCKACGRNTVTPQDMEYAGKFAARYIVGVETQSLFPEIYQEESSESDEEGRITDSETDDGFDDDHDFGPDGDNLFTRYTGDDPKMLMVNECYDTWDQWEPQIPLQVAAKNAIEKNQV